MLKCFSNLFFLLFIYTFYVLEQTNSKHISFVLFYLFKYKTKHGINVNIYSILYFIQLKLI